MLVKDFITKELPVLKSFDTGGYALALMDDFKLKHLPLLSEGIYRCLISEKDLLAMPDPAATIGEPDSVCSQCNGKYTYSPGAGI